MGAACRQSDSECQAFAGKSVPEWQLPICVRDILDEARMARPETELTGIAFHTVEGGRILARIGPDIELPDQRVSGAFSRFRAKDLLVLSVSVTETTFQTVRTVTHVLVALQCRRPSGTLGSLKI